MGSIRPTSGQARDGGWQAPATQPIKPPVRAAPPAPSSAPHIVVEEEEIDAAANWRPIAAGALIGVVVMCVVGLIAIAAIRELMPEPVALTPEEAVLAAAAEHERRQAASRESSAAAGGRDERGERVVQPAGEPDELPPSQFDALLPESRPAYSLQQLNDWLPELTRMVEAAAGRTFKTVPPVKTLTRGQLRAKLGGSAGPGDGMLDDLPGEVDMTAVCVLGLYDPDDATVYMVPGNLLPWIEMGGQTDGEIVQLTAKLVLAHELAHALQDQHLGLARLTDAAANIEESQALRATIEGHAEMVEDIVATKMGLTFVEADSDEIAHAGRRSSGGGGGGGGGDGPGHLMATMLEYNALVSEMYYEKGRRFFQHNWDRGGAKQVWRILEDPPKDTAPFIDPSRYWRPAAAVPGADAVVTGLSSRFGEGAWDENAYTLGAFTMRFMYRELASDEADAFVSMIEQARAVELTLSGGGGGGGDEHGGGSSVPRGRFASVILFELRGKPDLAQFIRAIEKTPPCLLLNTEGTGRDEDFSFRRGETRKLPSKAAAEADIAKVTSFEARGAGPDGTAAGQGKVARFARPGVVVEVMDVGGGLSDDRLSAIAAEVFRKWNEVRASRTPK